MVFFARRELAEIVTGTRDRPPRYSADHMEHQVDNQVEKVTRFNPLQTPGQPAWSHWSNIHFKNHLVLEPNAEHLRLSIIVECKYTQKTMLFGQEKSTAIFHFNTEFVESNWYRSQGTSFAYVCCVAGSLKSASSCLAWQPAAAQCSRPAGPEPFALAYSDWRSQSRWNFSLEKRRLTRGTVWHGGSDVGSTGWKTAGPDIFRWWQHDREDQYRSALPPEIYARGRTQRGSEARQQDREQGDNGCDSVPLPLYEA
jgi:hypothetical protein